MIPFAKIMNIGHKINLKLFWTFEASRKPKYLIAMLCNLIPLAKIMSIMLTINLKLLFYIWSLREAKDIKFP